MAEKFSQGIIDEAKKQRQEKGIEGKNFGEYDEAPGGGTPGKKGGRGSMHKNFVVADSPKDPDAIEAKEEGKAVRYMQPRNEDGTFTYNSANGKGLSTKKSRGHTDIPWLAGVDLTFLEEGAVFSYKDNMGQVKRLMSAITLQGLELHDAVAVYLEDERGFAGIVGGSITKKGRPSKQEAEAMEKGEKGKIGQMTPTQLENMSEARKEEMQKAKDSVRKGPFSNILTKTGSRDKGDEGGEGGDDDWNDDNDNENQGTKIDKDLLNNNPQKFMQENKEMIDKVNEAINNNPALKGLGLTAMDMLVAEDIDTFEDLIDRINNLEE